MKHLLKLFVYRYILPYLGLILVKALSSTYKIKVMGLENEHHVLKTRGRLIYAAWHQRFFPGIALLSRRNPITIMISQSRDGDFIARIVTLLGWNPVRGSSSKGGGEGLKRLKELSDKGYNIAHIVDGPKGPFGIIKPGLIRIAQLSGIPLVPAVSSGEKKWVFNSWDRFMVPKPFSRILVQFGKPIEIPEGLDKENFEAQRLHVEESLRRLNEETDALWNTPDKIREIFEAAEGGLAQWLDLESNA